MGVVLLSAPRAGLGPGDTVRGKLIVDHVLHPSAAEPDGWPVTVHRLQPLAKTRFRVETSLSLEDFFGPESSALDSVITHVGSEGWGRRRPWSDDAAPALASLLDRHLERLRAVRRLPPIRLKKLQTFQELAAARRLVRTSTPYDEAVAAMKARGRAAAKLETAMWRAGTLAIYQVAHAMTAPTFSAAAADFAGGFIPRPGDASSEAFATHGASLVAEILQPRSTTLAAKLVAEWMQAEGGTGDSNAPIRDAVLWWLIHEVTVASDGQPEPVLGLLVHAAAVSFASWWELFLPLQMMAHNLAVATVGDDAGTRDLTRDLVEMVDLGAVPIGVTEDNQFCVFVRPTPS